MQYCAFLKIFVNSSIRFKYDPNNFIKSISSNGDLKELWWTEKKQDKRNCLFNDVASRVQTKERDSNWFLHNTVSLI